MRPVDSESLCASESHAARASLREIKPVSLRGDKYLISLCSVLEDTCWIKGCLAVTQKKLLVFLQLYISSVKQSKSQAESPKVRLNKRFSSFFLCLMPSRHSFHSLCFSCHLHEDLQAASIHDDEVTALQTPP